jgi:glutathione S-transferase
MLKIYGFDFSTPSNAVRMWANAIGLEHEYVNVNLPEGENQADAYLALNPTAKVPAIDDDGFTLGESVAIMKYISRKHGAPFYPPDFAAQAAVDQWCSFVSVHIYMAMVRVFYNKVAAPQFGLAIDEQSLADGQQFLAKILPVVDKQLVAHRYLAGDDLTIADFAMLSFLDPTEIVDLDLRPYPKLTAWRDGLRAERWYQDVRGCFGESMMAAE